MAIRDNAQMRLELPSPKRCCECRIFKPHSDFTKSRGRPDGLEVYCRPCKKAKRDAEKADPARAAELRAYHAAYAVANRLALRAIAQRWRERNRDIAKARVKAWQAAFPDRQKAAEAKWRAAHPERSSKHRAMKLRAIPSWANAEAVNALYAEAKRITLETGIPHHVDHIVPLNSKTVCGLHCEANLRVIPGAENAAKSNRHWPDMP